ncbi:MAG: twitching motility protein PilI [Gammaproteobacteria bacterium]|jgi:twitching motility protein PilI
MSAPAAMLPGSALLDAAMAGTTIAGTTAPAAADPNASGRRYGVLIGGQRLLLDGSGAVRVLETGPMSRLPNTHSWCLGLANVRGQLVPVFDLAQWQNQPVPESGRMTLVIGADDQAAATLVDLSPRNVLLPDVACTEPALPAGFAAYAGQAFALGDGVWTELDWDALFDELKLAAVIPTGET